MLDSFWFWIKLLLTFGVLSCITGGITATLAEAFADKEKDYVVLAGVVFGMCVIACIISLIGAIWAIG